MLTKDSVYASLGAVTRSMAKPPRLRMNNRQRKIRVHQLFDGRFRHPVIVRRSVEDKAWEAMAPVGREFGSPDYERLALLDELEFRLRLAELVSVAQTAAFGQSEPEDTGERSAAHNVQIALREWGQDVSLLVAAFVWKSYSNSVRAEWLSGAETVHSAKSALFYFCASPHRHTAD